MKQKKQNRILAALLAVAMMFQMLPMMAFAAEDTPLAEGQAKIERTGTTYTSLRAAAEAAQDGDTIKLGAGEYFLYDESTKFNQVQGIENKHLTFEGSGIDVTIWKMHLTLDLNYFSYDNCFEGADTITFKNMTLEAQMETGNSYADYRGFGGIAHTVVENCEVNGKTAFWGEETAKFINTTFNAATRNGSEPDYSLWTYITKEWTFDNCTFNAKGKVINVWKDYGAATHDIIVNFNNCTVDSTTNKYSALIVDDSNMGSYKYIIHISDSDNVKAAINKYTCSQVYGVKEGCGNQTEIYVEDKGQEVCVWKNGELQTHKYSDGEKDIAYNITYSSSNPNGWVEEEDGHYKRHVIKTCKYCGYKEEKDETGYKLAYELNGGVPAAGEDYAEKIVAENETVKLAAAPAPAQEGVYFLGWDDGKGKQYNADAPITLTANTTLTAQWGEVPPVVPDTPDGGGKEITTVIVAAGTTVIGYYAGTGLLMHYYGLPYWPKNRSELALMLWEDADRPMPESTLLYPDVGQEEQDMDLQYAARWAMENELIPDLNWDDSLTEEEMKFYPNYAVSRARALHAWCKAQQLKQDA